MNVDERYAQRLAQAQEALAAAEAAAAKASGRSGSPADPSSGGAESSEAEVGTEAETGGERDEDYERGRDVVLRQLTAGPRTRAQLATKLKERDVPEDAANAVLDRMEAVGLVDDWEFAQMWVRSRQRTKGLASKALVHELRDKGVAQPAIDEALEQVSGDDERERARELVEGRVSRVRGLDRQTQVRRLAGFLARKGYGSGVSYSVIQEALDAMPEHRPD